MMANYLNQVAIHNKQGGTDERGQLLHENGRPIKCRKQNKTISALTATGRSVTSDTIYYTTVPVDEGDKLDGKVILAVDAWASLHGKTIGYRAVV